MKTKLLTILILVSAFSVPALAQGQKIESVRTELSEKNCMEREDADPGNGVLGITRCRGTAGYSIEVENYEHGQGVSLITPAGEKHYVDMFTPMGEESYLDKEIEWRGIRSGNTFNPSAIIFEHNIVQRADRDKEPETKIAVVRIGSYNGACLIADGVENKNYGMNEARGFADDLNRPCLSKNFLNPPSIYNEEYSSIDEFLSANMSKLGSGVTASAKGDLNGDGLDDWAGVLWDTEFDFLGGRQLSTLYVLLRDKKTGSYRVDGISDEAVILNSDCCNVEDLRIKNESVYLQINARRHDGIRVTTYQFKLHDRSWRLIGLRIYNVIAGDKSRKDSAIETDMNLLTGDVIVSWYSGNKREERKRRKEKFEEFYLSGFEFGNVPAEQFEQPPDWVQ